MGYTGDILCILLLTIRLLLQLLSGIELYVYATVYPLQKQTLL